MHFVTRYLSSRNNVNELLTLTLCLKGSVKKKFHFVNYPVKPPAAMEKANFVGKIKNDMKINF